MGGHAAVDLAFAGLGNTLPEDGEVFCPVAGPRYVDQGLTGWLAE